MKVQKKISMESLVLAWRKAKVDLYYSTNPPLLEMADYEENLTANLEQLQRQLCGEDEGWVTERAFTGDWTLMPKSVRFAEPVKEKAKEEESEEEEFGNDTTLIFAAPEQEWQSQVSAHKKPVAALDIHAYIIQCNNRQYGDSRIRAPYKNRWQRDLLRVKGGNHDYCITGEIDVQALRQFQSSHRSSARVFKPVPDGFNQNMAYQRKVLPKGE